MYNPLEWTARGCGDGLAHFVSKVELHMGEAKRWLRYCDLNDDFVSVQTLPLGSPTCMRCLVKGPAGTL